MLLLEHSPLVCFDTSMAAARNPVAHPCHCTPQTALREAQTAVEKQREKAAHYKQESERLAQEANAAKDAAAAHSAAAADVKHLQDELSRATADNDALRARVSSLESQLAKAPAAKAAAQPASEDDPEHMKAVQAAAAASGAAAPAAPAGRKTRAAGAKGATGTSGFGGSGAGAKGASKAKSATSNEPVAAKDGTAAPAARKRKVVVEKVSKPAEQQ